jgi:hypothetical protein
MFLSVMITALMLPSLHVRADEKKIPLQLLDCDVRDVLALYQHWTGRKIWVDLRLHAPHIAIRVQGWIPQADAIRLVRTTLLERYGIELRDSGDKETFASWSDDPKYKEIQEAAKNNPAPKWPIDNTVRPRVRIIEPTEPQK